MGPRQGALGEVSSYPYAPRIPARGIPGRVSVVVVHYQGESDLSLCCDSVLAQGHPDLELVVVDNGSSDCAPALLPPDPRLRRLWLPDNEGFAAGANAGLLAATGDVLVLLNPDAAMRRGCLQTLLTALEDADIAAPRILLASEPDRLDNCGSDLFPDGLNWCRGRGEAATGRYEEPEDLLVFSGAAVAFRRSALALCGGLDPAYWAYGEDADLALRAARFGLRCRYVPGAVVTHRVGGSFGSHGLLKAFLVERNRVRVAATHLPLSWLIAAPLWTGARVAALGLAALAGKGAGGGFSPRDRALLPLMVGSAWIAGALTVPGSLGRRLALGRLGDRQELDSRLGQARVGIRALLRRPAA
jgi:GT2 family glycosyltransferase